MARWWAALPNIVIAGGVIIWRDGAAVSVDVDGSRIVGTRRFQLSF